MLPVHSPPNLYRGCALSAETNGSGAPSDLALRVVALFVILVGSTLGALFPVIGAYGCRALPRGCLDAARYLGSGVIIGTGFIHLLAPGIEALGSPCLAPAWRKYPYALGLCLASILAIFVLEIATVRGAAAHLAKSAAQRSPSYDTPLQADDDTAGDNTARIVGVAVLEFGAVIHSVLIGLTLAADRKFKVLFAVLVVHQVFEGLGIGARLASAAGLSARVRVGGAVVFGLSTPVGMAVGLAMRTAYSADAPGALVVSGVLDSLGAGVLIYTALVELLGREILFNEELMKGPARKLAAALGWVFLGCVVMALLGKWV
ncbi:ZIP-like iron-zinc transporter [Mycena belliarum]|uniref:ZIP-like iron-zinc transporter n=1 Tax=Mycena belliarum TaxID=1033014 RepID=A0AAD6XSL8_9AGAR|nr:ZIP-like iron-zinc transporter [Mycena belliae]